MATPAQKELNRLNKKAAYERLKSVNPDQADVVSKFGGTSYSIALVMRSYGISKFETNGHTVARKIFFEMEIGGPGSSRFSINQELLTKPLPFMGYADTDDGEIDRGVILAYLDSDNTYDFAIFYSEDEGEIIYPSHYTPMYENLPPHSYLSVSVTSFNESDRWEFVWCFSEYEFLLLDANWKVA